MVPRVNGKTYSTRQIKKQKVRQIHAKQSKKQKRQKMAACKNITLAAIEAAKEVIMPVRKVDTPVNNTSLIHAMPTLSDSILHQLIFD